MQFLSVQEVLRDQGLRHPKLRALVPDVANYSALLLQPEGSIEGDEAGVRHHDGGRAHAMFLAFLESAVSHAADLVVTPEYSMPWSVVEASIEGGPQPRPGVLWVLGCASITYAELQGLRQRYQGRAKFVFENLVQQGNRFTDPLVYMFMCPRLEGGDVQDLVLLVQFKTHPMGDEDHYEINGLQVGTVVYIFGRCDNYLALATLICSDVFAFHDLDAENLYDRALIIHIQLNPRPRHAQYREYRDRLFRFDGTETEVLTLNWAQNVAVWEGGKAKSWANASASAWYLRPSKFDGRDATLIENHRRGLYYTWMKAIYTHALFFNFEPAVFLLTMTKVYHRAVPASVSRRRGPQLRETFDWSADIGMWTARGNSDDCFCQVVAESGGARAEMERISSANPLEAERVLALVAGSISHGKNWHYVTELDSFEIDTTEVIKRMTFCQDTEKKGQDFRIGRLRRLSVLWSILHKESLPPSLVDLKGGFQLSWSAAHPHQNCESNSGQRATLVYLGEEHGLGQVEEVAKKMADLLWRSAASPEDSRSARQRLAVWYGGAADRQLFVLDSLVRFDEIGDSSEFDIGRAE